MCIIYVLWLYFDHIYSQLLLTPLRSILFSLFPKCFESNRCWPRLLTIHWDVFDPPEVIPCLFSSKNPPTFSSSRGMGAPNSFLLWNVGMSCASNHGCHELCAQRQRFIQKTSLQLGLPTSGSHNPALPSTGSLSFWGGERVREMLHLCLRSLLELNLCTWFCCEAVC